MKLSAPAPASTNSSGVRRAFAMRAGAVLVSLGLAGMGLSACTPKPAAADPVAQEFLDSMSSRDEQGFDEVTDQPEVAARAVDATFSGLQAESLSSTLNSVDVNDSIATAHYTLTWDLPRERHLSYDTSLTLTKSGEEWKVRYLPTVIHPDLGSQQHLELRAVEAKRAGVISSDGVEILSPGTTSRLLVDTAQLSDVRVTAAEIASAVNSAPADDSTDTKNIDAAELADSLDAINGVYSVGTYSPEVASHIATALSLDPNAAAGSESPAIWLNDEPALVPVEHDFAPDIMSRVARLVSDDLEGANGWKISVVNQHGAEVQDIEFHAAQPAAAVKVGIDYGIQRAAQQALSAQENSKAMIVAMRPSTGEILAVAQTKKADRDGEIALSGHYPPGSVFKIITAAAGLEKQNLQPSSPVPCPGTMDIYGRVVVNFNSFALGTVPLREAFAASCNTTFADISTKLQPGELADVGRQFGLGLNYDIPGLVTETGSIPKGETPLERTEAGYGQGLDLISPFGIALVSSTVAAGKTPTPSLIAGEETTVEGTAEPVGADKIEHLRTMMRQVVLSGTAAGMQADGEIFGKTGEAEYSGGSHAWFTGFRDDLAFATLVVDGGGSGISVNITDEFLRTWDEMRSQ